MIILYQRKFRDNKEYSLIIRWFHINLRYFMYYKNHNNLERKKNKLNKKIVQLKINNIHRVRLYIIIGHFL